MDPRHRNPAEHVGPQDTVRPVSPVPPYEGRPSGPRHVHAEPIPGTGGPFRAPTPGPAFTAPLFTTPGPAFLPFVPRRKSVLLAALLGFVLGPLGLVYSTLVGTVLMTGFTLFTGLLTLGHSLPMAFLLCGFWGAMAAHGRNERVRLVRAAYRR